MIDALRAVAPSLLSYADWVAQMLTCDFQTFQKSTLKVKSVGVETNTPAWLGSLGIVNPAWSKFAHKKSQVAPL